MPNRIINELKSLHFKIINIKMKSIMTNLHVSPSHYLFVRVPREIQNFSDLFEVQEEEKYI